MRTVYTPAQLDLMADMLTTVREGMTLLGQQVNLLDVLREVVVEQPGLVQTRGDSHAGEVETAIMMAAYPDLVRGTAPEEWPKFPLVF